MSNGKFDGKSPKGSSIHLDVVTSIIFVITVVAIALLAVQLEVLEVEEGDNGDGSGNGNGNGKGNGKGAGEGTSVAGGGIGKAGENESARDLGFGAQGGGGGKLLEPKPKKEAAPAEKAESTVSDQGKADAGKAEGTTIDKGGQSLPGGGIRLGKNKNNGGGGDGGNGKRPKNNFPQIVLPEKVKWLLLAIMAITIVATVTYIGKSYFRSRRAALQRPKKKRRKKRPKSALAAAVAEDFIQTIEMTYDNIERMGDIRRAIVLCYARLTSIIAEKGIVRTPDLTPREFFGVVRGTFDVSSTSMKGLTLMFEEAVFSEHPMDLKHREAALKLLREVAAEVEDW